MAVVGLGYWGPNRLRTMNDLEHVEVGMICDLDAERLRRFAHRYPTARATADVGEVLADETVEAVVIATPLFTHHELAARALRAGKHTFVEKPLAATSGQAQELIELAVDNDVTLMCGHTFLYSPPVQAVKEIIDGGDLGELFFISSSRVNLGPYRSDVSVIYDLGAHDFSILAYWLGRHPVSASAVGRDVISKGIADVAFVDLKFDGGLIGHVELSWLAPSKLRRTVVVGSRRMLVYEDGSPEPLRIYDSGIEYKDPATFGEYQLSYRTGDIVSLRLPSVEPIAAELADFLEAIAGGSQPRSDGALAVGVIKVIEAAEGSLRQGGLPVATGLGRGPVTETATERALR